MVTNVWRSECGVIRLVMPAPPPGQQFGRRRGRSSRVPCLVRSTGAGTADVEHRVTNEHPVDHGVPVEPRQGVELAPNGSELAPSGLELAGEDLDLGPGGIKRVDPVVTAPTEPLAKRQPIGRSRLWNPVPSQERQRVGSARLRACICSG